MLPQLREPLFYVVEGLRSGDVVDQEGAHCVSVVGVRYRSVPFLPGRVPNLSSDLLIVDLNVSCGEFNPDGRLGVLLELVLSVTQQQIRFSHA